MRAGATNASFGRPAADACPVRHPRSRRRAPRNRSPALKASESMPLQQPPSCSSVSTKSWAEPSRHGKGQTGCSKALFGPSASEELILAGEDRRDGVVREDVLDRLCEQAG